MESSSFEGAEQQLAQLLLAKNSNNEAEAATAIEQLESHWFINKDVITVLFHMLCTHQDRLVVYCSGAALGELVRRYYSLDVPPDLRYEDEKMNEIKRLLLSDIIKEEDVSLREIVVHMIYEIARIDLSRNSWDCLIPQLCISAKSSDLNEQTTAVSTLWVLLDPQINAKNEGSLYCETMNRFRGTILKTLEVTMVDPNSDPGTLSLRILSVRVLFSLVPYLSASEWNEFENWIPRIRGVLHGCIEDDTSNALVIIDQLMELLTNCESLPSESFKKIILCLLDDFGLNNHCLDSDIDPMLRITALNCVYDVVVKQRLYIEKIGFGPELINTMIDVLEFTSREEKEMEENKQQGKPCGLCVTDDNGNVSCYISPRQYSVLIIVELVFFMSPSGHFARIKNTAGYEKYANILQREAANMLPCIINGLTGEPKFKRDAALRVLIHLAEFDPQFIAKEHASFLPLIYEKLDLNSPDTNYELFALEVIIPCIDAETVAKTCLPHLCECLHALSRKCLSADICKLLKAIILHVGRAFTPYFKETAKLLTYTAYTDATSVQPQGDPEQIERLCQTHCALTALCYTLGYDVFRPNLDTYMATTCVCLDLESLSYAQKKHICTNLTYIIGICGWRLDVYTRQIVPVLLQNLRQASKENAGDDIDDLRSGCLQILANFWRCTSVAQISVECVDSSLEYFRHYASSNNEEVRSAAVMGLWNMSQSMPAMVNVQKAWREAV